MNDKLPVIVLAGYSCAGKSTISKGLVDHYGFNLMEQYVIYHNIAMKKGYKRTRYWLADIGNETFVKETTLETVRIINALDESKGVIIDASYGPVMDTILRSGLINAKVITIHVNAVNQDVRVKRMMGRLGGASEEEARTELTFRDSFLKDVGLENVIAKADFEILNRGNIEDVLEQLESNLDRFGISRNE